MTGPAPERREIVVRVGDWGVDRDPGTLLALGLGSCVALMLYDPVARAGGMAHVLLPSATLVRDRSNPAKFPETAVPFLVGRLSALGAEPRRLVAKLAGGASMFGQLMAPGTVHMGERNLVAARLALHAAGIPVVGEAVGGERGRSVRFHLADGRVEVWSVGADVTVI